MKYLLFFVCGVFSFSINAEVKQVNFERIVGGKDAADKEVPFIVSLRK